MYVYVYVLYQYCVNKKNIHALYLFYVILPNNYVFDGLWAYYALMLNPICAMNSYLMKLE